MQGSGDGLSTCCSQSISNGELTVWWVCVAGGGVRCGAFALGSQSVQVEGLKALDELDGGVDSHGEAEEVDSQVDVEEGMVHGSSSIIAKDHPSDFAWDPTVQVEGQERAELCHAALSVGGLHVQSLLERGEDLAAGVAWVAHEVLEA